MVPVALGSSVLEEGRVEPPAGEVEMGALALAGAGVAEAWRVPGPGWLLPGEEAGVAAGVVVADGMASCWLLPPAASCFAVSCCCCSCTCLDRAAAGGAGPCWRRLTAASLAAMARGSSSTIVSSMEAVAVA